MSLFSNLSIGSQALISFQKGINVVNKNMTNVYTEGYKREIPTFSNFPTAGVDFDEAKRVYDDRLLNRLIATNQEKSYYETLNSNLGDIEQIFNDINGNGFGETLDNFFYSMNDVITSPDNLASRDSFLYASQTLTGRIRESYEELSNIRENNQKSIQYDIDQLNDKLQSIAKINENIKMNQNNDSALNNSLNERDKLLNEISGYIDTKVVFNSDGTVDLFSAKGHALVLYDKSFSLSFKTEPQTVSITDPDTGDILTYTKNLSQILINGNNLTQEFQRGSLGGKLATEKGLDETIYNLNIFTFKFANEINSIHSSGFDLNGNAGENLFINENSLNTTNIDASNIKLNISDPSKVAASDSTTDTHSNNENMKTMLNLKENSFTFLQNQTFNEFYNSSIVADIGLKKNHIDNLFNEKNSLYESTKAKLEEISGVNMDEELIRLSQLQRSYEASARIITVTDELLQTVMGLVD
ncbi:flagellar hook-associated protein FlgK [Nitrosophilus labii]|uniref:flagellar hook-associated protein FlgK n=1 Tax=Nitrosophilus labii TaxID=2706014 RepID=UPI00165754F2|nr:flagellar hook-associated protein FlgK [Nitrosophilus labii]